MNARLDNVYWIGGSSCAGKTTVAKLLAKQFPITLYKIDDHIGTFELIAQEQHHPIMSALAPLPWEERRVELVRLSGKTEIDRHEEVFSFVINEIEKLAQNQESILVEGSALLPWKVLSYLASKQRAIWFTPTEAFQWDTFPQRGSWVHEILGSVEKPDETFKRWMDREQYIARQIRSNTNRYHLRHVLIDGKKSVAEIANLTAKHLQLKSPVYA